MVGSAVGQGRGAGLVPGCNHQVLCWDGTASAPENAAFCAAGEHIPEWFSFSSVIEVLREVRGWPGS